LKTQAIHDELLDGILEDSEHSIISGIMMFLVWRGGVQQFVQAGVE
jgi:hypothetical protein